MNNSVWSPGALSCKAHKTDHFPFVSKLKFLIIVSVLDIKKQKQNETLEIITQLPNIIDSETGQVEDSAFSRSYIWLAVESGLGSRSPDSQTTNQAAV